MVDLVRFANYQQHAAVVHYSRKLLELIEYHLASWPPNVAIDKVREWEARDKIISEDIFPADHPFTAALRLGFSQVVASRSSVAQTYEIGTNGSLYITSHAINFGMLMEKAGNIITCVDILPPTLPEWLPSPNQIHEMMRVARTATDVVRTYVELCDELEDVIMSRFCMWRKSDRTSPEDIHYRNTWTKFFDLTYYNGDLNSAMLEEAGWESTVYGWRYKPGQMNANRFMIDTRKEF